MKRFWAYMLVFAALSGGQTAKGQYARGPYAGPRFEPLPSVEEPVPTRPVYAPSGDFVCGGCEEDRAVGGVAVYAYEAFRGIADGGWENNGAHAGVNYSLRLGEFTNATRFRAQFGGSIGVYKWAGTDYRM